MPPKTPTKKKGGKSKASDGNRSPSPVKAASPSTQVTADAAPVKAPPPSLFPFPLDKLVATTPTPNPIVAFTPFLLIAIPTLHVLFAPYTKVEESFTLHAVHDVLRYGLNPRMWARWDHRTFPGAVPRSFVPPIILGIASFPASVFMGIVMNTMELTSSAIDVQQIVRLTLVCFWAYSMNQIVVAVRKRFGNHTATFFVLLSVLQFHIPFYAGRTLPNFTALPLVNLSIAYVLHEEYWRGVALLTAAATVVRLELALMVVPLAINLVVLKRMSFTAALTAGLAGGFGSLAIAAPIDYALWSPTLPHPGLPDFTPTHAIWPELSAMIYNIVDGQADNWGVMPRIYYVVALAKMLIGAFPLLNIALMWSAIQGLTKISPDFENKHLARTVGEVVRVLGPGASILVASLSNVGHKEWRFIVYVVPILNIIAAAGAAALWSIPDIPKRVVARLAVVGLLLGTAAVTLFSAHVSQLNYPGGAVWETLETLSIPENSKIHFPSYPLQTGASLFTFVHAKVPSGIVLPRQSLPAWEYVKDEDPALLTPAGAWDAGMDYVVTPDWTRFVDSAKWTEVAAIDAYAGVRRGGKLGLYVAQDKKLAILQRVD